MPTYLTRIIHQSNLLSSEKAIAKLQSQLAKVESELAEAMTKQQGDARNADQALLDADKAHKAAKSAWFVVFDSHSMVLRRRM